MNHPAIASLALAALFVWCLGVLFFVIPKIAAWEKANGYPFGRLCEVYNSCQQR